MPDSSAVIRKGEKRPLYGQIVAVTGTLTISSSPSPTCTLYDSTGVAVAGLTSIAVTGFDSAALATPQAWLDLDTLSPTDIAPGFYTHVFKITATGSDGIARLLEPNVEVEILDLRA